MSQILRTLSMKSRESTRVKILSSQRLFPSSLTVPKAAMSDAKAISVDEVSLHRYSRGKIDQQSCMINIGKRFACDLGVLINLHCMRRYVFRRVDLIALSCEARSSAGINSNTTSEGQIIWSLCSITSIIRVSISFKQLGSQGSSMFQKSNSRLQECTRSNLLRKSGKLIQMLK